MLLIVPLAAIVPSLRLASAVHAKAMTLLIDHDVTFDAMVSDRVTWLDRRTRPQRI